MSKGLLPCTEMLGLRGKEMPCFGVGDSVPRPGRGRYRMTCVCLKSGSSLLQNVLVPCTVQVHAGVSYLNGVKTTCEALGEQTISSETHYRETP